MTTPTHTASAASAGHTGAADVLVVFGITGDLARVMTFRSLYRLELRGLLDCPVVGVAVDDWTIEQLAERARTSIVATGQELDEAPVASAPRLYVESLNEMFDAETTRIGALDNRVPGAVLAVEVGGAAVALAEQHPAPDRAVATRRANPAVDGAAGAHRTPVRIGDVGVAGAAVVEPEQPADPGAGAGERRHRWLPAAPRQNAPGMFSGTTVT